MCRWWLCCLWLRWLRECGYPLTYVRNIADIDDKIIARAAEKQRNHRRADCVHSENMHERCRCFGCVASRYREPEGDRKHSANELPRLKPWFKRQGISCRKYGDVYYAVREFAAYGQLSGKSLDDLRRGRTREWTVSERDPLDFVLVAASLAGDKRWFPVGHLAVRVMAPSLLVFWCNSWLALRRPSTAGLPSFAHDDGGVAQSVVAAAVGYLQRWRRASFHSRS